ncbi:hypothetical protein RIF29_47173 [Crotalaria pallida]|uniref:Uncharacterized protein n=1 Tax=Crotalaria pallida TaxID=3830 RepID=A0AAN9DTA4_CROPI
MPAYLGVHGRLNRQRPVPHSQHPLQSRAISPLARRSSFRSSSTMSSLDVQSVRTDMTLHVIIMGTSSSLVSSAGLLLSKDLSRDLLVEEKTTSSLPHLLMKEQQERVFERQMQNAKKAEDAA